MVLSENVNYSEDVSYSEDVNQSDEAYQGLGNVYDVQTVNTAENVLYQADSETAKQSADHLPVKDQDWEPAAPQPDTLADLPAAKGKRKRTAGTKEKGAPSKRVRRTESSLVATTTSRKATRNRKAGSGSGPTPTRDQEEDGPGSSTGRRGGGSQAAAGAPRPPRRSSSKKRAGQKRQADNQPETRQRKKRS